MYGDKTVLKINQTISDQEVTLRMELALHVDFGKFLMEAVYEMEGDGFLILKAYDKIKAVEKHINLLLEGDKTVCNNMLSTANQLCHEFPLKQLNHKLWFKRQFWS